MWEEETVEQPCVIDNVQDGVVRIEVHAALVVVAYLEGLSSLDGSGHSWSEILHFVQNDTAREFVILNGT